MSDDTKSTDGGQQQNAGGSGGDTWTPPRSKEEFEQLLNDNATKATAKYADYDDLKGKAAKYAELEEAKKSDAQRLIEERDAATGKATESEMRALKLDVALEAAPAGMSPQRIRSLAGRLQGKTRDELITDARQLFADVKTEEESGGAGGQIRRPSPDLRGGGDGGNASGASMNEILRAQLRR